MTNQENEITDSFNGQMSQSSSFERRKKKDFIYVDDIISQLEFTVNVASEVLENDGMTNQEKEPAEDNDVSIASQQDDVTSQQDEDDADRAHELEEKLAKAEKEVASVEVEKQPVAEDNVTKEVAKTEESAPESLKEQTPTEEPSSPREEVVTPTKKFVKKEIFSPFDDDVKPLTYKQLSATPSRASQLPVWPPVHQSSSSS